MLQCASLYKYSCAGSLQVRLAETKLLLHVHCKIWQTLPNCPSHQITYQPPLPLAVHECVPFYTPYPVICFLPEVCKEAICQTAKEANENLYNEYTWHLVESQSSFCGLGCLRGVPPLSWLRGEPRRGMVDEGRWGTLLCFDLKSALQSTAIQRRHALMADNMLYLYSSWV